MAMKCRLKALLAVLIMTMPFHRTRAAAPPLTTVIVTQNQSVASGNALFIAVDREELNSLTTTGAVRMYNAGGNNWIARFAVPRSTTKTNIAYKLFTRSMASGSYCNTGNGTLPGTSQNAASALWTPGYSNKTVYYLTAWTNVTIYYKKSDGTWAHSPVMAVDGAGRGGSEKRYKVSGIGEPGQPLVFVGHGYESGVEKWDNPSVGGIDNNYVTSLDTLWVQDGNVFNYEPPATVSAPQVISVGSWASSYTGNGIPSRGGRVYLPRGYTQNTTKKYPVLYLHDGQNVFDPGGDFGSWSADKAATAEIAGGRMRETIIVAVNNTGSRMSEYGTPQDGYTGNYYLMYLAKNVKPTIDSGYRTLTNRMNTGNMGSSLGGLISSYIGLSSNVFGLIGAVSPSYWYGPNYVTWLKGQNTKGARIWMDMGTAESDGSMWNPFWPVYEAHLDDGYVYGDDLKIAIGCGEGHNEGAWSRRVGPAMRYLYNVWDEPNLLETNAAPSSPGTLRFSSATYSVAENGGSVRIYVNRDTGFDGAASVAYATANGTAIAGTDYTAKSGSLSWTNGDSAAKYFDVTIANNGIYEGAKTFSVNLSSASGATLGLPDSATVTILDDEPAPPDLIITNPAGPITVSATTTAYSVQGTLAVANWTAFRWTNNLTGGSGTQALAAAWTIANIPLDIGSNVITVSATKPVPVVIAQDDANDSAYADDWSSGDNGGTGFGSWTLGVFGTAGHFVYQSRWGMWSHETNNLAEALRPFSNPLGVGDTFSVDIKNGWIWEGGGSIGAALRDGSGNTLWQIYFNGGQTNYQTSAGQSDIEWTDQGIHIEFTLTSPTSYSVKLTPEAGSTRTVTGSVSGTISEFRAWSYSNGTDDNNNPMRDFYFNNLEIISAGGGGILSTSATVAITREGDALHDGIPLSWWNKYGLGTNSTAAADSDMDGASNWEEYIADTNPTNSASVFSNIIVHVQGDGISTLRTSAPTTNSRLYDVWFSPTILDAAWTPLNLNRPGANNGGSVDLLITNQQAQGFYRTGVKLP